MHIDTLVLGAYENNCFVVRSASDVKDCIIIDTGLDSEPLVKFLSENELKPAVLILTHGHADHIAGVGAVREIYPDMKVCIHKADLHMMDDSVRNLSTMAGIEISTGPADIVMEDEGSIEFADIKFDIIHTSGHTPGGMCLYNADDGILFAGDTLFCGSIGRTDFPGYDVQKCFEQLVGNIQSKLMILPEETKVFTGHGPATSIRNEKKHNPYLNG